MNTINLSHLLHDKGLSLAALAREIGVNKSTVTRWAKRNIPAERVAEVSKVTGLKMHELRPDIFPSDTSSKH